MTTSTYRANIRYLFSNLLAILSFIKFFLHPASVLSPSILKFHSSFVPHSFLFAIIVHSSFVPSLNHLLNVLIYKFILPPVPPLSFYTLKFHSSSLHTPPSSSLSTASSYSSHNTFIFTPRYLIFYAFFHSFSFSDISFIFDIIPASLILT